MATSVNASEVQIDVASMRCPNATSNVFLGLYRDQPARFIEKRQLSQSAVDLRAILDAEVNLRRRCQSARHVPIVGVYHAGDALGNKVFLVEAPYHYVGLEEYLASNPGADRKRLLREAIDIVAELHSQGIILVSVLPEDFVIDPEGRLSLSNFESVCVASPGATHPIHHTTSPSIHKLAFMAPELLDAMRNDSAIDATKASDVYSLGCFAYQLFTGTIPLPSGRLRSSVHMAQVMLIEQVVDRHQRPSRPAVGSHAHIALGLTNGIWATIEECWRSDSASRPSALIVRSRII